MSCYHPIRGFRTASGVVFSEKRRHGDFLGDVEVPCGQCIGCRMQRAAEWELRCLHESQMHSENCFVTLTYGRDKCPAGMSLDHTDFQKFMKRLRRRFVLPVRFYMCGEYGEENARPHYHACLFGIDFRERKAEGKSGSGEVFYSDKRLSDLWGHGFATVQDFTRETASYCARYVMKKTLGRDAKEVYGERKPDYNAMSLRPGIGATWFARYGMDVFPHDYVVADGVERRVPKYYDKLLERSGDVVKDEIEYRRYLAAREHREDQTPERLAVREIVHTARVSQLKRSMGDDA